MDKELEVKILNIDLNKIEEKIISLGGELIAIEKQVNTLLDNPEKPIKSYMDAYLRVREVEDLLSGKKEVTLTLKKKMNSQVLRENKEFNVKLEEKETILEIYKNLGFHIVEVGYKDRKSYNLKGSRLDIDQWNKEVYPYPYMEIEVSSEEDLEEIVRLLEIPKENISKLSIIELQQKLKTEEGKDVK